MVEKLKRSFKDVLGRYPRIYFLFYRLFASRIYTGNLMIRDGVELVIEGFPRSANTFAVVAFNFAQQREVPMAHHLHVEAQILRGVELGLPVLVLIRHPIEAIKSLIIREQISVEESVKRYIKFYSAIQHVREHVVIADFAEVTQDFAEVIRRLNVKYSTNYQLFVNSKENIEAVFHQIDEINNLVSHGRISHVARPTVERKETKILAIDQDDPIIQKAVKLYEDMVTRRK